MLFGYVGARSTTSLYSQPYCFRSSIVYAYHNYTTLGLTLRIYRPFPRPTRIAVDRIEYQSHWSGWLTVNVFICVIYYGRYGVVNARLLLITFVFLWLNPFFFFLLSVVVCNSLLCKWGALITNDEMKIQRQSCKLCRVL